MKILMLNYEFPPIGGGGGIISKEIAVGLSNLGHQITVLTSLFEGLPQEEILNPNLKVLRLKVIRKKSFQSNPIEMADWILKTKKFALSVAKAEKFDLCFANFVMPGGEVALFLKRKIKLPYVVISHGHDIPWVNAKKQWPLYAMAYFRLKNIIKQSLKVFVQTKMMEQNLIRFYKDARYEIIPNGLKEMTQPSQKPNKIFTVIAVGRLVSQKDPVTYLNGFIEFALDKPSTKLLIFGDGPKRKLLEKIVLENRMTNRISFFGKVEQKIVLEAFSKSQVYLSTSLNEGMSLALLEALSFKIPAITTKVSGVEELIDGNNGAILNFKSPKEISKTLEHYYKMWEDKLPFVKQELANEKILQFKWEHISERYHQSITNLL